jgi:hypothetical protein
MKLNFEKNLDHQSKAVANTIKVFDQLHVESSKAQGAECINPKIDRNSYAYERNIRELQKTQEIDTSYCNASSHIIDIMMETGTGKTYTYTKTIFELNKALGIFKFVIVVPTLSIKAGTLSFLKSESARSHFMDDYSKTLEVHIVESQKSSKGSKSGFPAAVRSFVEATAIGNKIQVLLINAGMLNSETMQKPFDLALFDRYAVPFEAITSTAPFVIIDEPHKFAQENKTWEAIKKMSPQFILRYGATFPDKELKRKTIQGTTETIRIKDYHNLVYQLTSVDAFRDNLVKGVMGHVTDLLGDNNALLRLIDTDGKQAHFELIENNSQKKIVLAKGDDFERAHRAMYGLQLVQLNKTTVLLSNGLELKKGDKLNPYSYSETLQDRMLQKTIAHHFELERELLCREVRIKPLTLFFIDNIEEYLNKKGKMRKTIETLIKAEAEKLLRTEKNEFYRSFLQKTIDNIAGTHGGYFSKSNLIKDEEVEKEINEILHDKEAILSLDNPRRFIFSKWTLREGWDNPNVFQICKLRSSGSEISKLQEVGRGLRLPVNEYGNRVKDSNFFLNYFVDFTENQFVDHLVKEINDKSGSVSIETQLDSLDDDLISQIVKLYDFDDKNALLEELDEHNVLKRDNTFKDGGLDYVRSHFPLAFQGVDSSKIRMASEPKKTIRIRTDKYSLLKEFWEQLNERAILEYQFKNEQQFEDLFVAYLQNESHSANRAFEKCGLVEIINRIQIQNNRAYVSEEITEYQARKQSFSTMSYSDFLKELSKVLFVNIKTLHKAFCNTHTDINLYLNMATIRAIKQNFEHFLLANAFTQYTVGYQKVSNAIHPTKLTKANGNPLEEIPASDIGVLSDGQTVAHNYLFDQLFYDSELERENILQNIDNVTVFTKIPKNSIKIPVAGGKTYSPDFAYIVQYKNQSQQLHFVIESKNVLNSDTLRQEELLKIKHAEAFFKGKVNIHFKTQFSNDKIISLLQQTYGTLGNDQ